MSGIVVKHYTVLASAYLLRLSWLLELPEGLKATSQSIFKKNVH